ncbi:Protein kinase domain-containing protein [Trichoderma simmonsii]|uniref:Protein kinase domain-containing protein n=1 Tax=Trichoderma simmonsii TaxID=1491479 RepID=A0A8G0PCF4_9HYPO|nr:Protein kinase domain-containing protein [Trichoderma simmonsii]
MIDRFQYNIGVSAEDLAKYCHGGYHPVHLNDLLCDGRYRILNKLGFGSFSTVWLARDEVKEIYVSIKIVVAEQSHNHNGELQILQTITRTGDTTHPGHKHVSHLMDSFYHEGPNGRHLCIVLELLGPKISSVVNRRPNYRLDGRLARRISSQLLLAVDYIRSCGVTHGDIHLGNVLFRVSGLNGIPTFDDSRIGNVSRKDGVPSEKGVPEYLVEPVEYKFDKSEILDEIQLVDFGESFLIGNPPKSICTPTSLHPPELVFRHPLTEAVDIWNLGCTTYELVIGRTPFEAWMDDRELVPQFQKVLGGVPDQWIQDALKTGVLTDEPDISAASGFSSLEEDIQASYANAYDKETLDLNEEDLTILGSYLRRMCIVEPTRRASLAELMSHPWVQVEKGVQKED